MSMEMSARLQRVPIEKVIGEEKLAVLRAPLPSQAYTNNEFGKKSAKVEFVRARLDEAIDNWTLKRLTRDGEVSDWKETGTRPNYVEQWFVFFANDQPIDWVFQAVQVKGSVGAAAANLPAYALKKIAFGDLVMMGSGGSGGLLTRAGTDKKDTPSPALPPLSPKQKDAVTEEVLSVDEEIKKKFAELKKEVTNWVKRNKKTPPDGWKKATDDRFTSSTMTEEALQKFSDPDQCLKAIDRAIARLR